jgi:hypothetical protein
MNSAIRASGRNNGTTRPGEAEEGCLHLTLNGSAFGLELPTEKIGTVVVDGEPESAFLVWVHLEKVEGKGGTSRKGWTGPGSFGYP